jgi:S-adenosylmethionine hydrolase
MYPIIALLTDFGISDIYVGVMKAVMRTICPTAQFIDITHSIQPQNIAQGAFALYNAYQFFPKGTIFLIVVDPGVGSQRRAIAAHYDAYTFVAPDNGVLSYILNDSRQEIVELTNGAYRLKKPSATFHGRDIFAPAAAYLAAGIGLLELGAALDDMIRLPSPRMEIHGSHVVGEALHIDRFGNIVTSIGSLAWEDGKNLLLSPAFYTHRDPIQMSASLINVTAPTHVINGVKFSYSDTAIGEALSLIGSHGFLEIAINQGDAARKFNISIGDPVDLRFGED